MKNSSITRMVFLGAIVIISIIAVQMYWFMRTWDAQEQEFHERVNLALRQVATEFGKLNTLPQYDLIERVSSNYYVVNVNQVINANQLEYFLKKELEAVGLEENFRYAIHDCATSKMVGGNYIQYSKDEATTLDQQTELPTFDKYLYYFGIRFPNHQNHILMSMIPTLVMSGILLLAIIFFTYSIFIILRQKRLSEMQKDFINNMTHEFKTPISTIKISADVFINDPSIKENKRLSRYAQIIKEQNDRLNGQVEKVLQLARIERNNFQLKLETVDLHEVLENCLKGVQVKIEGAGGTLKSDLQARETTISADKLHLSNIFHNLLDNAMKYCQEVPQIQVRTENFGDRIHIRIEDEGIGIAKEYQERVFQKFYRVPTGNVHDVKGFGLGLFYIKNICRTHGWKLELSSEPEEGTQILIAIKNINP